MVCGLTGLPILCYCHFVKSCTYFVAASTAAQRECHPEASDAAPG